MVIPPEPVVGPPVVLIHGAWHEGHCWDAVARVLRAQGHRVFAPTLPGRGPAADRYVGHADCVAAVVALLEERDLRGVVLGGHSLGGSIIQAVADRIPERIGHLVFISGFVVCDGESVLALYPPAYRTTVERLSARAADRSVRLPYRLFRDQFMRETSERLARDCYARLVPEPWRLLADPVALPRFFDLDVPATYVHARDDRTLPADARWGWVPRMPRRLPACACIDIEGGHESPYTSPDRLAAIIAGLR
ncbi:MAG: alpha/beta fold hydrolase [Gammaproteobacteria bacterium]